MFNLFNKKKQDPFKDVSLEELEGEFWIISGKMLGEKWNLVDTGDEFLVGRHLESEDDISFDNSVSTISKKHCIFRKTKSGFELEDLQSANGTFVNKKQIEGKILLKSGDEITLGRNEVTFKFTLLKVSSES
jgi:pSer/pThr/pTyr-binding forkhead associated (FHA) protein